MICNNCGFDNMENSKFCQKCGNPLNYQNINKNSMYSPGKDNHSSNNTVLIICATLIIIVAIIAGTFLFLNNNGNADLTNDNQITNNAVLNVNTASFYLDGNPNSGIPATVNVGKEYSGQNMEIMTTYSRDGSNLNNPSSYENHIVDDEGNIQITEFAPIPRYPDYCLIEIRYNNQTYKFGCNMEKRKGSQTSVPTPL